MLNNSLSALNDPIAALATPQGAGAVAIIRVTGKDSHILLLPFLCKSIHKNRDPQKRKSSISISPEFIQERILTLVDIFDPTTKEILDTGLVVFFKSIRSYTGEDSAEIHIHGGPFNVQKVLGSLLSGGFRLAEPGEFTKRAYLNGKIDLATAEGIRHLVEAHSEQQWLAARQLASGTLSLHIEALRSTIIESIALLEAQIDFPDEGDTAHLTLEFIDKKVSDLRIEINKLLNSFQSGFIASHGLKVVLIGPPNAGKSTLMNTLLNKERSLVTPIPGTTRDYVEEKCLINGRLVRLFDLAGMRDTDDFVESLGIKKAYEIGSRADLALILLPSDEKPDFARYDQWIKDLNPKNHLLIITKCDLKKDLFDELHAIRISCKTGYGLEALKEVIAKSVDTNIYGLTVDEPFITDIRHFSSLNCAAEGIFNYFTARAQNASIEILGTELRHAAKGLLSIIGEIDTDDVLDHIFGRFCIGK